MLLEISIILFSILVITNKNPIISVLFLIALFLGVALFLIIIGLTFIGLSYLLVYIGAVSIIFLFILMLIDIRLSELHNDTNNNIFLSIIVSIIFYNVFYRYNDNNILNINLINNNGNATHSIYNL
jgi:NADH-ubiquinone oxidoreductase chain 6